MVSRKGNWVKKYMATMGGGVGFLGMGSVVVRHKALGISEEPYRPDQLAHETALRWVDNVRKVAVSNATIQKYFPETYKTRIAPKMTPKEAQQAANKEAIKRAQREIGVLR